MIKSGGKQHRVEEGEQLKLEKIEAAAGETIEFDEVLMVGSGSDMKISALVEGLMTAKSSPTVVTIRSYREVQPSKAPP